MYLGSRYPEIVLYHFNTISLIVDGNFFAVAQAELALLKESYAAAAAQAREFRTKALSGWGFNSDIAHNKSAVTAAESSEQGIISSESGQIVQSAEPFVSQLQGSHWFLGVEASASLQAHVLPSANQVELASIPYIQVSDHSCPLPELRFSEHTIFCGSRIGHCMAMPYGAKVSKAFEYIEVVRYACAQFKHSKLYVNITGLQTLATVVLFCRNIGEVNPRIIYLHYL